MDRSTSQMKRRAGLLLILIPLAIFIILFMLRVVIDMSILPAAAASINVPLALPGPPPTSEGSPEIIVAQSAIFLLDYLLILTTLFGIPCVIAGFILWIRNRK